MIAPRAAPSAAARSADPAVEMTLLRLNALSAQNPGLRAVVHFYQHLIPALHDLERGLPALDLDLCLGVECLPAKLQAGIPLLTGEPLAFDPVDVRRVFAAICEVIKKAGGAERSARQILKVVHSGVLDPIPLLSAVQSNQAGPAEEIADRLGLDPPILELAAQNTLKVFLRRWRANLEAEPSVDLDLWRHSRCPFCGAEPGLAEIRGVESARYLRCLCCGAGWPYPSLMCAFCGNDDHHTLDILLVDDRPGSPYLHTCRRCHRRIKTIVTYEEIPVDGLIVEDLSTLPLDYIEGPAH